MRTGDTNELLQNHSRGHCKTYFSVILSIAKDLELIEKNRFFASLE